MSFEHLISDQGRIKRLIGWSFPYSDWIKVNSHGAAERNLGLVWAGAVVRDAGRVWIFGQVINL